METRMLLRFAIASVAVLVGTAWSVAAPVGPAPQERLYLIDGSGGILVTFDPVGLNRLSQQLTGNIKGMSSLTYGRGRLFSIERNAGVLMDQLIAFHPATALATTVGPTGILNSNAPSVKYDPTRDEFFVLYQFKDLYRIDPASGQMTYVAQLHGAPPKFNAPTSMAINSAGEAFISQIGTGPAIARLDLSTGQVDVIGRLPMGGGRFRDTSFDAQGRMWAILDAADDSKDGLYIVDPVELTFELKLLAKSYPLSGMNAIAVVPLPPITTYCEGSAAPACAPRIGHSGLPSASADSGFSIQVRGTPTNSLGMLFYGPGASSPPIVRLGLCFAPPYATTALTPSISSGTGGPCDASWSIDLNPGILAAGSFAPGDTLRAQWVGFDSSAPANARRVVSDALEFALAP